MVESSRNNSQNVDNIKESYDIEMLYNGEEAEGFDISNGSEWIYPTNYPVRSYQKNIVSNALFKNTLVCLPTGLGKTFIAAVVMYNYHRWYPKHIVVFMAHSKPLVAQQVNACCNIMGISPSLTAELNGNMQHSIRKKQWESKKIFFLTPQVFNNDLARGNVKAENIRCIVIDEAHKALGNQAYCQVIRSIKPFNSHFRVLALSATPGDDMNMVKEVIQNLMISHLEIRNEEDPDIRPYLHEKKVETVIVELEQQILDVKELFLKAVDKYIKPLIRHKLLPQSFSSINPFSLVLKQRQFLQNPSLGPENRGLMLSNFSVAISLFHALEELVIHGMRSFVTKLKNMQTGEGATNKIHHRIANDDDIKSLIEHVENILGPDRNVSFDVNTSLTRIFDEIDSIETNSNIVYSHPKFAVLEKIIHGHFEKNKESTRVIVFCKSRQCTGEICNFLARFKPLVRPMIFIGQSQSSGGIVTKGFSQAAQLTVMKRFREGVYNTLVATCVAEEGLDIGEVDLIVNFDSGKNSNTQVQRSGRTGRKRDGRVVNLVTEGKEHQNYNISVSKGKKMNKRLVTDLTKLPFYLGSPRLIPKGIKPVCQEMFFSVKRINEEEPKETKRKSKGTKKKLQEAEENRTSKRMKDSTKDLEGGSDLWTMISDKNFKDAEKSRDEVQERSLNENEIEINFDDVRRNGELSNNEVEVINVTDKPTMLLYNDDVEEGVDEPWELLSDSELQDEERNLVKQYLRENNSMRKPRNNFRNLLNLKRLNKFCKLPGTSNKDLVSKMKAVGDYVLNDDDKKFLTGDNVGVETLVKYINESRRKLLSEEEDISVMKEKENESQKVNVSFDIDPDEFFHPFEDFLPSAKGEMVSSTPLRSNKENLMPPPFKNLPLAESNFQFWDGSEFFNMKENFFPKLDSNVSDRGRDSLSTKKDLSLISITQALDIVNNPESSKPLAQKKKMEKHEVPGSPSSPILFFSQKQKTRNKFVSKSPILTQGYSQKRKSRKCLTFRDEQNEYLSKEVPKLNFEDADNSDLFIETEVALQNHLEELEKNFNEIEKHANYAKKIETREVVDNITVYSSSSGNTEDYDLGMVNLDENYEIASFLKAANKSNVSTPKLEDPANKNEVTRGTNKNNMKSLMNCKEETNEQNSESLLDPGSFMKSNKTEFVEGTRVKPEPKLAVVRPMGFENTSVSYNPLPSIHKSEIKKPLKEEEQSFSCNFSLFGDDDFGDECFNLEPVEKTNEVIEKRNILDESSREVDRKENGASNDSDVFVNRDPMENDKNNPCISPKDELDGDVELFQNMLDDSDLSEGAMEAIKAVEVYEKNAKLSNKQELNESPQNFDSDDSEDFFFPARRKTKQLDITEKECPETRHNKSAKEKKKKVKYKGNPAVSEFLEREADITDDGNVSSDEENTTGLDEYDSSFVDEREVFTQAHDVDMTAKYLQSTKSPKCGRPGMFKIPKSKVQEELNVFSQIGSEGESEYENDSFCVSDVESHTERNEISELELAEVILRDRKKRKRVKDESVTSVRKKKFKRVLRIQSDSSDDDIIEIVPEPKTSARKSTNETTEVDELFDLPFPTEISTSSSGIGDTNIIGNSSVHEVLFISSRQVASAPDITTCLRAKWNMEVHVRSAPEADYIISWRVGINRISLSDFTSGSSTVKCNLKEIVEKLSAYFQQPVLIVEDDKNKGLPQTVGAHKFMWAKHSSRTLFKILQNNVKVVFSRNKDDTARIIAHLCKEERSKGQYINLTGDLHPEIEKRMKFYSSLPGVNIANSFRIASRFSSLSSFMRCCDSVHHIMRELGLRKEAAASVYQLMFTAPS